MQHTTICVTGGTGFVGQEVIEQLLENRFHVRALVRSKESAKKLADAKSKYPSQLELIIGEATNPSDVRTTLEGCDALVHLVGTRRADIKRTGLGYIEIDLGSALASAVAMERSGVKRILLLSAAALGKSEYVQIKARAEQTIITAKLNWTIFRPAFIVGPDQKWPVVMEPILGFFSLLPGKIGNAAKRAGNISRKQLAHAFVMALKDDRMIGKILEVPELKRM